MKSIKKLLNHSFVINIRTIILGAVVIFIAVSGTLYFSRQWSNPGRSPQLPLITPSTNTFTPTQPTVTDQPTYSETPTYTPTPEPTLTYTPTPLSTTQALDHTTTATTTAYPADWAQVIQIVQVLDGDYFAPKEQFTKIWRVKNLGTTTWTKDYDLVYDSGTAMNTKLVFPLSESIKPGKFIDIKLKQTAPNKPGTYQGAWMLRNAKGKTFGTGLKANQPLMVKINVLNIDPANAYDFLLNYCEAEWWNSTGETINCKGESNQARGFVLLDINPSLENGSSDFPVLWVHTDKKLEGIISGKYPAYTVKNGDHFKTQVGCIAGYPKCNITFKLLYSISNNPNQNLGTWKELAGGGVTKINVDLSPLAGQKVQFILRLVCTNNYPESAHGFWMRPRIVNVKPLPSQTPTMTETLVPTPTETLVPDETPTDTPAP
ncbi:MAG: NBR1-Ig-like domain-containing protein [Anaerolineales bacterium]